MSFLPEDDQEYLRSKGLLFEEKEEALPDKQVRRAVLFPGFTFDGNLVESRNGARVPVTTCDLLILIPIGYATTKLDSFYTIPRLCRPNGSEPQNAHNEQKIFSRDWQFWSRHLDDKEWRADIDGLETYLQYVRAELRRA